MSRVATHLVGTVMFVVVLVILAAILGVVDRHERFWFVGGVVLLAAGTGLLTVVSLPPIVGGLLSVLGFLAILWSLVPLLRQSPSPT